MMYTKCIQFFPETAERLNHQCQTESCFKSTDKALTINIEIPPTGTCDLTNRKRLLSGLRYIVSSNLVITEMIFRECIALSYTLFSIFRRRQSTVELFDIIFKTVH